MRQSNSKIAKKDSLVCPILLTLWCIVYILIKIVIPIVSEDGIIGIIALVLLPIVIYLFFKINIWLNK